MINTKVRESKKYKYTFALLLLVVVLMVLLVIRSTRDVGCEGTRLSRSFIQPTSSHTGKT